MPNLHFRPFRRVYLLTLFALLLGYSQVRDSSLRPDFSTKLTVVTRRADTGETVPSRVYLFKGNRPYRLSPVDAMLPLRADTYYRERLWRQNRELKVLEVTARDASHFILLEGRAAFHLPRSRTDQNEKYRLEAYHGMFFEPAEIEFTLQAEEEKTISIDLKPIAPGRQDKWLAADDHIHLMRAQEDDELFLKWLQAEDLAVGNFLELQRQQHAALQYAFGRKGEARARGFSIRSGHETRSRFYGHTLVLGPEQMIRPLSIGHIYANSPAAYPFPTVFFQQGRDSGGVVGFAHFDGSMPNSTLIMNLARKTIDFIELFQFGVLHTNRWYELLNAGFRVVGIAGSDFPASLRNDWPRIFPLLGPERALVKAEPGESAYDAWEEGVRQGAVLVSNGPLLEFTVNRKSSGATESWSGRSKALKGEASVVFHRPIEKLEIVVNGRVVAIRGGDTKKTALQLPFETEVTESSWIAARASALHREGEYEIWAHANPAYFLKDDKPVYVEADRAAVRERWEKEAEYYRNPSLVFEQEEQRQHLLRIVEETRAILARPAD
ncbi:MAG: CehA/McbA family metallohydrolase [Bryobacterales bacterium]|nr:CehA/McbA family metallohydrolase [Bryobacterales bacterium]